MKARLSVLLVVLALLPATSVFAGFDAFLKMDPIQGEATASGHSNEMVVLSFFQSVSNNGSATFGDVTITKQLDKASPQLYLGCAQGTHYPTAVLTLRSQSGGQVEFYKLTLSNVIITSVQSGGNGGGGDRPTETITLNFQQIEWRYQPVDPGGNPVGAPIITTFDRSLPGI